jgi:hypothetical protein
MSSKKKLAKTQTKKKTKKEKNPKVSLLLKILLHVFIVSAFTFLSWGVAEAGGNFLPAPWNSIFFFSRFFLDVDILVFGLAFFLYFEFIHYFEPWYVAIIVMVNLTLFDFISWAIVRSPDLMIVVLNWLLSMFLAVLIVFAMSVRYEQKKHRKKSKT